MRPRGITRGNRFSTRGRRASGRSFNEAAGNYPRKPHVRGNSSPISVRFNEAAGNYPRKLGYLLQEAAPDDRFNEAAGNYPRKPRRRRTRHPIHRGFNEAAGNYPRKRQHRHQCAGRVGASMRPRGITRGNDNTDTNVQVEWGLQ